MEFDDYDPQIFIFGSKFRNFKFSGHKIRKIQFSYLKNLKSSISTQIYLKFPLGIPISIFHIDPKMGIFGSKTEFYPNFTENRRPSSDRSCAQIYNSISCIELLPLVSLLEIPLVRVSKN